MTYHSVSSPQRPKAAPARQRPSPRASWRRKAGGSPRRERRAARPHASAAAPASATRRILRIAVEAAMHGCTRRPNPGTYRATYIIYSKYYSPPQPGYSYFGGGDVNSSRQPRPRGPDPAEPRVDGL